jgi:site-specific DNA-methyltransferase (adenine-specific)
MNKKPMTIRQAAKELGVSSDTLRRWDRAGKFKATRHPMNNYRVYSPKVIEQLKNKITICSDKK